MCTYSQLKKKLKICATPPPQGVGINNYNCLSCIQWRP